MVADAVSLEPRPQRHCFQYQVKKELLPRLQLLPIFVDVTSRSGVAGDILKDGQGRGMSPMSTKSSSTDLT
jgi:hypothetical protein